MWWIFPLSLLIVFEVVADIASKEWAMRGGSLLWTGAVGGYIAANTFWLWALRNGSGLARGATIFSVATAIIAAGLGAWLYHEQLSRLQLAGVALGVISLAFIFS